MADASEAEKYVGSHMSYTTENAYSDNATAYLEVYEENKKTFNKFLEEICLQKHETGDIDSFVLTDFGTADGKMVIETFAHIIEILRKNLGNEVDITVVFEDQLQNNYDILKQNIKDFAQRIGNIVCLMSSTSLYERCLPKNFLDFGICVMASHWLSKRSVNISNGFLYSDATPEEYEHWVKESKDDFYNFLACRLHELKTDGILFVSCPARNENGICLECLPFQSSFKDTLVILKDSGWITDTEFLHINCYFLPRKPNDFKEVFTTLHENGFCFEILNFEIKRRTCCPHLNESETQDPEKENQRLTKTMEFIKSIFYSSIFEGLSSSRTKDERTSICDLYFDLYKKHMRIHSFEYFFNVAEFFVRKNKK